MKIKKIIFIIAAVLMGSVPLSVSAAEQGSVRVELPEELAGATVCCFGDDEEERTTLADSKGVAVLSNLEAGTYRIHIPETKGYEFTEAEVKVPMWDETNERMSYEVSVIPKYSRMEEIPKTGDKKPIVLYGVLGSGALAAAGAFSFRKKR